LYIYYYEAVFQWCIAKRSLILGHTQLTWFSGYVSVWLFAIAWFLGFVMIVWVARHYTSHCGPQSCCGVHRVERGLRCGTQYLTWTLTPPAWVW